jgi:hypothetical protein
MREALCAGVEGVSLDFWTMLKVHTQLGATRLLLWLASDRDQLHCHK